MIWGLIGAQSHDVHGEESVNVPTLSVHEYRTLGTSSPAPPDGTVIMEELEHHATCCPDAALLGCISYVMFTFKFTLNNVHGAAVV